MLSRIFIQNFALIDRLEIHLQQGLQVITGETGAGKSIILGALRLILGERADTKAISNLQQKSIVEAEFLVAEHMKAFFDENDLDFESPSIIRREILPTGKSRAFINDVPVTLELLRQLSSTLIDIHSQFETSDLFSEAYQFSIIDGLGKLQPKVKAYQSELGVYRRLRTDLEKFKKQLAEGNKESDYKKFLLNELEEAQLDELDYAELQSQIAIQENAGMISEHLAAVVARFEIDEVGVIAGLHDSSSRLEKVAEISPSFEEISRRLSESYVELKDILNEVESAAENMELDPEYFASLNNANNRINALFLKHSVSTVEELKKIRDGLAGEQNSFAELENHIRETEKNIALKEQQLSALAEELAAKRKTAAPKFTAKAEGLLKQLGLEKAQLQVELTPAADFHEYGKERIDMMFSANPGFPLKPIQNAISGGERSRVMLAVKKIMAENAELPTLILDEIDTGVSGKVAEEMGNLMREMSKDLQLIVITHLAQVAAKGDNNYKVVKKDVEGRTQSDILALDAEAKLREIAQLLSGSTITEAAIKQAQELMK